MIFHITLEKAEDGWIVAECPAFPGCVSQGKDEKEAVENIKAAITAWLWAEDQKVISAFRRRKAHSSGGLDTMGRLGNISGKEAAKAFEKGADRQSARWNVRQSVARRI